MATTDRLTYRAIYTGIELQTPQPDGQDEGGDKDKGKGKGKGKGKKNKTKVPWSIFNKATLIATTFGAAAEPPDLEEALAKSESKSKNKAAVKAAAKTVTKLLKPSADLDGAVNIKAIAGIKEDVLLDLIAGVKGKAAAPSPGKGEFAQTFGVSSFGYLHLERLRFTPEGTQPGELLYSLPLAPGEEVTITHKTWSKTKREFTDIIENLVEKSLTTQRTESLELSESTQSQFQFGAEMSSSFQGSGTIGVVELGGSASSSLSTSYNDSATQSTKRGMQLTDQASARSKQEHKTTFQVSTEAGVEDESRRLIRNPNRTHAVQYDYYRNMRKWRIDLERYGVRLMFDVMIRDPGARLRQEFLKRRLLQEKANGSYSCDLTAADIDPANLPAGVGSRPSAYSLTGSGESDPKISDSSEKSVSFSVPSGYEVDGEPTIRKTGGGGWCEIRGGPYSGDTGSVAVSVHRGVAVGEDRVSYTVTLDIRPTAATVAAWEAEVVAAMCAAGAQAFESERAAAQAELDAMSTQAADTPTIVLRKDERQEVMRGVAATFLAPAGLAVTEATGDIVRYVHEAFEWENMTYFLYPYFWFDVPHAMEIEHPDMLRRDFLRSGWARVLVPVRPGYERSVVSYAYTGSIAGVAPSEMRSVAQQVVDDTETRYPFEASPEGGQRSRSEIIGTWYDYTPTDGVLLVASRGATDVAEPALARELTDAADRRAAEIDALRATAASRGEVARRMTLLPDSAVTTLDAEGDRILVGGNGHS